MAEEARPEYRIPDSDDRVSLQVLSHLLLCLVVEAVVVGTTHTISERPDAYPRVFDTKLEHQRAVSHQRSIHQVL